MGRNRRTSREGPRGCAAAAAAPARCSCPLLLPAAPVRCCHPHCRCARLGAYPPPPPPPPPPPLPLPPLLPPPLPQDKNQRIVNQRLWALERTHKEQRDEYSKVRVAGIVGYCELFATVPSNFRFGYYLLPCCFLFPSNFRVGYFRFGDTLRLARAGAHAGGESHVWDLCRMEHTLCRMEHTLSRMEHTHPRRLN